MEPTKKICIYTKDIQKVTGQSPRHARRILADIRRKLGKDESQYVTVEEFCLYASLPYNAVMSMLDN